MIAAKNNRPPSDIDIGIRGKSSPPPSTATTIATTTEKTQSDLEEAREVAERQARMVKLADERRVRDARAEREAIDRLVAKRDVRQSTIDTLRSAEEVATR